MFATTQEDTAMSPRALYSCNLSSIGRTTHAEGTAGAHLRYIGRERAVSEIMTEHMPDDPQQARTWMDQHERTARKNARLCDKIRLALPRQLDEQQRAQLVRDYAQALTGGRVPWFAAIHQTGKDAHNPHVHLVVVDRDIDTGKRLLCLSDSKRDWQKKGHSEPSPVEWVRERWEHCANRALERADRPERMDRRTLEAQGIDRMPQIHIGPRANHIDTTVKRPESKAVPAPTPRNPDRVIDYPLIDAGRTRRERNAEIIDLNLERAVRSPHFETRVWAQFERDQRAKDRPVETQLMAAARRRTLEERRIRRAVAAQVQDVRVRRDAEARLSRDWIKQRFLPETLTLRQRHAEERSDLNNQQRKLFGRFFAAVDFTGRTRAKREATRMALSARHKTERQALAAQIKDQRSAQLEAVKARYQPELEELTRTRQQRLTSLSERHEAEMQAEDTLLQARIIEREQDRRAVEQQITAWKRSQQERDTLHEKTGSDLAPEWDRQIDGGRARDHSGMDARTRKRLEQAQKDREDRLAARSKAGRDWEEKDAASPEDMTPEQRADHIRAKIERAREKRKNKKQDRNRRRRRDFD
ncbi:MobA/MobL family protein [Sulfitobacter sp. 1A16808]|uniref:MobA/MobL family protein n=1 Tax=Sulfitobacter sp. 1A16808 TaxID=3368572 RepID=UPI00374755A7